MTIAVDFDGTIVTHEYPNIGKPIPFAIETLKKLQQEGHHQLILWTCREGELLQEAIDYCASKGLEFYSVNSNFPEENADIVRARKLEAELFIDDRNLGGLPDWGEIYRMLSGEGRTADTLRPSEIQKKGSLTDFLKRICR